MQKTNTVLLNTDAALDLDRYHGSSANLPNRVPHKGELGIFPFTGPGEENTRD